MSFRPKNKANGLPEDAVSADKLLQIMAAGGVLVDVRTLNEYRAGHIPGAALISSKELAENAVDAIFANNPLAIPEETTVVLVCDNGLRSSIAAKQVSAQGLPARYLSGGLRSWVAAGQYLLPGPPR